MAVLCTICARGGSKGVPNKNTRLLCGKPLIAHTIEQARAQRGIDRVAVSTDSPAIAEIALQFGAEVPVLRPAELATDTAAKAPAIKHLVRHYIEKMGFTPDYVIDLDPTAPLRNSEDIARCLTLIQEPDCDSLLTGFPAAKNPYFNMVELDPNGYARISKEPPAGVYRRQDAPPVYSLNASIYAWKRDILLEQRHLLTGRVRLVEMPHERSVDIDSPLDFEFVEFLLRKSL